MELLRPCRPHVLPGSRIWMWKVQAPQPVPSRPLPAPPVPWRRVPAWVPLEPKSAAGPEGRAALSAALFPSRPAAPRWLHTLAPACRPTFPDILQGPGPLASWRAALGSDPAPAPTRRLCRGWGSGEAVVTALFLWAGHPGARFPRRPPGRPFQPLCRGQTGCGGNPFPQGPHPTEEDRGFWAPAWSSGQWPPVP